MPFAFTTITGGDWKQALQGQQPNAVSAQLAARRVRCPDCGAVVNAGDVRRRRLAKRVVFGECPQCAVGSPAREWKTA